MTVDPQRVSRIVKAVSEQIPLNESGVSLQEFRDVVSQLKGAQTQGLGSQPFIVWIAVFLEEKVLIAPTGAYFQQIEISEPGKPQFYRRDSDFAFLTNAELIAFGSKEGRYTFTNFLKEIVSPARTLATMFLWLMFWFIAYIWIGAEVTQSIATSCVSAMAIFITVFVLFVLNVHPEHDYGLIKTDRVHRMSYSDRFIAGLGFLAIVLSIGASAMSSALPEWHETLEPWSFELERFIRSFLLSSGVVLSIVSFWMVLFYHFARRHELLSIQMAQVLMREEHKAFLRNLAKRSDDQ